MIKMSVMKYSEKYFSGLMKLTVFAIFLLITLPGNAQQQGKDVRTDETKIADLMMQLPAQGTEALNSIMEDLCQLGGKVITGIAPELVPPGEGDDTRLRYVVSGMVKYASEGANTEYRKTCSEALCKSLGLTRHDEVKDFLLQELQYIAGEEAVPLVAPLLQSERLCDPAARVLIRIGSENAEKVLMNSLNLVADKEMHSVIQALGEVRYIAAAPVLGKRVKTAEGESKKVLLKALAEIGDPSSKKLLAKAAKNAAYGYDNTEATAAYLFYLSRLAQEGHPATTIKACRIILKSKMVPLHTRTALMGILAEVNMQEALPFLYDALNAEDKAYRMGALRLLCDKYTEDIASTLQRKIEETDQPEIKAEIIGMLGAVRDEKAFPLIVRYLNDTYRPLQLASIQAAARTGEAKAVQPLLEVISRGDEEIVSAVKEVLLTIPGDEVTDGVAEFIPGTKGDARVALIRILAERRAEDHSDIIFNEVENSDPEVSRTAAVALSSVVKKGDEKKISGMLNRTSDENLIKSLQDALFASVSGYDTGEEQVERIFELAEKAGGKGYLYYAVFADIGGEKALAYVKRAYYTEADKQKESALQALCNWSDYSALNLLFEIAEHAGKRDAGVALKSYISMINGSPNTDDQKVLMFRKAMERAIDELHHEEIIEGISRNSTLSALVFVSRYLEYPNLQQSAVQAVQRIVLGNPALYGDVVKEIVLKAVSVNEDPEASYQKEAMLKHLDELPEGEGYVSMFNGKDLEGWKGLVGDPLKRAAMTPGQLAARQKEADEIMRRDWVIRNGNLVYEGKGFENICTQKMYGDFELIFDWKTSPGGDGGVYLRGTPQVQIWDTSRVDAGARVGSGGLYNNKTFRNTPLVVADNPAGEWNTFRIKMIGDKVTVYLNGMLVTDNVILENYWDKSKPVFNRESIELQAHNSRIAYRDLYIRELPRPEPYTLEEEEAKEGFVPLFNGTDLTGWTGNKVDYFAQDGMLVCKPTGKGRDNLYTEKEYSDFILRFEFQLTPGANNGLGIRTPLKGDAAYVGMELQILDNGADIYRNLKPYQYHGSVYGVIPAKRGYQNPVGEWNTQEVQAIGTHIRITLNGEVILDGDIAEASNNGTLTMDEKDHPGLLNPSGYIGFLGHGSDLKFRKIRIKDLSLK
jgi:HEAT repeat protein